MSRPVRVVRVGNENDENSIAARNVLSKGKALNGVLDKKFVNNENTGPLTRRRAALGDVSNVNKKQDGKVDSKLDSKLGGKLVNQVQPLGRLSTVTNPTRASTLRAKSNGGNNLLKSKVVNTNLRPLSNKGLASSTASITTSTTSTTTTKYNKNIHSLDEPIQSRASKRPKIHEENTDITSNRLNSRPLSEIPIEALRESKSTLSSVENTLKLSAETQLKSHESQSQKQILIKPPPPDWDDLDADDYDDPLMVSEYVVEIFDYLYESQSNFLPDANYVSIQTYFTWRMRDILIDWLVEVHTRFRLLPETLFLAVNIFDRYMTKVDVPGEEIQIIGITALFIAAKYEEVYTPSVGKFAYMVDNLEANEILEAERGVLRVLEFSISYPNPMNFLRRISKADDYDINTRTIGKYLLEISLFDHRLLKYKPSEHSAAAMFLARKMLNRPSWDNNMKHYSGGYDEVSLKPILSIIVDYLISPVYHEAFFKKYASKRFLKASIIARTWAKENRNQYPIRSSTTSSSSSSSASQQ